MGSGIVLYSSDCNNCIVAKMKLKDKGIDFEEVKDMEIIMKVAQDLKFSMLPIMGIDGTDWYQGVEAIERIEEM